MFSMLHSALAKHWHAMSLLYGTVHEFTEDMRSEHRIFVMLMKEDISADNSIDRLLLFQLTIFVPIL